MYGTPHVVLDILDPDLQPVFKATDPTMSLLNRDPWPLGDS